MSPTPWWGTLVVAAVGLFGVLLSQLWTSGRDQRRADNEKAERQADKRATLYAEFYATAVAVRLFWVEDYERSFAESREHTDRLAGQLALIRLLSPLAVANKANDVVDALRPMMTALKAGGTQGVPFQETTTRYIRLTSVALKAMRDDLDLGLQPRWWQVGKRKTWRQKQASLHAARPSVAA